MKVNFKSIVALDIEGNVAEFDVYKIIAKAVYYGIKNLDLVETARDINAGKEVELSATDVKQIKTCVLDPQSTLFSYVRKAISDFFDKLEDGPVDPA